MLEFLVAGTSGALIIVYVLGLKKLAAIWQSKKAGAGWSTAIANSLGKNVFSWLSAVFAVLLTATIVLGLSVSIVHG